MVFSASLWPAQFCPLIGQKIIDGLFDGDSFKICLSRRVESLLQLAGQFDRSYVRNTDTFGL